MQLLSCAGESGHDRSNRQFQRFCDLPIGEILEVEHDDRETMPFLELFQRLMKGKSIGAESRPALRLIEHLVEGNFSSRFRSTPHLAVTVSQDADKPSFDKFHIAKTRTRTISLQESLLGQFFRVRPRASPPVGDPEQEPSVLPYPIVEHLVRDLHRKPFLTACTAITNRVCTAFRFIPNRSLFLANLLLEGL